MGGMSGGANVWGALELAKAATQATTIVTVVPDSGMKYLSKIFNPQWLSDHNIVVDEEELEAGSSSPKRKPLKVLVDQVAGASSSGSCVAGH